MLKIKDIMRKNVIAATPQTSIKDVATAMVENNYSGIPVVRDDQVVGVITEKELLKIEQPIHIPTVVGFLGAAIYMDNPLDGDEVEKQVEELLAREVSEVMSEDFESVSENMDVHDLAEMMINKDLEVVPVVNDQNVFTGIVTRFDMIKLLAAE